MPSEPEPYSKSIEYPVHKPIPINLSQLRDEDELRKTAAKRFSMVETKSGKFKNGYPSSFYRIKYHNSQRKKQ